MQAYRNHLSYLKSDISDIWPGGLPHLYLLFQTLILRLFRPVYASPALFFQTMILVISSKIGSTFLGYNFAREALEEVPRLYYWLYLYRYL